MKIRDIFSNQSVYSNLKTNERPEAAGDEVARKRKEQGEDRVSISPLARQYQQVSGILADDEAARAQRVASLKAQVEQGTYKVASEDVAASIVSHFAVEKA